MYFIIKENLRKHSLKVSSRPWNVSRKGNSGKYNIQMTFKKIRSLRIFRIFQKKYNVGYNISISNYNTKLFSKWSMNYENWGREGLGTLSFLAVFLNTSYWLFILSKNIVYNIKVSVSPMQWDLAIRSSSGYLTDKYFVVE